MKRIASLLMAVAMICHVFTMFIVPVFAYAEEPSITLQISGMDKRTVLSLDYGFNQPVNTEGQVAGIVKAYCFTIRVKGLDNDNNDLFEWAVKSKPNNLSLEFTNTIDGVSMKTIKLTNAYCVGYTEHWDNSGNYYEEIRVTAYEYENGSARFESLWH